MRVSGRQTNSASLCAPRPDQAELAAEIGGADDFDGRRRLPRDGESQEVKSGVSLDSARSWLYVESAMTGGTSGKRARLIYLDLCALKRLFDEESSGRIRLEADAVNSILQAALRGRLQIVRSAALEVENDLNPEPWRRDAASDILESFGSVRALTDEVGTSAREFVTMGVGAMDALHLASAVDAGAEIFVTVDRRLLRTLERLGLPIRGADPVDIAWEVDDEAP